MLRYNIRTGVKKIKTKTALSISVITLGIAGLGGALAFIPALSNAASTVVYNSIPSPSAGNYTSEAFEAQSASEFGGQVQMTGTATNPTVTVQMSSWGCQNGNWFSDNCVTTPGSNFSEDITLNVYSVGASNALGTKIVTATKTFQIPFRPSADDTHCTGPNTADGFTGSGPNGEWFSSIDNKCYNGLVTPVVFNLTGTIPQNAIITVAYNTTHFGYNPIGESAPCFGTPAGCGYDSLNVALTGPVTVGSQPDATDAYLNSTWTGAYCDNGVSGTGSLRLDTGCWTGFQPNIKVEVNTPDKDNCKNNGWKTMLDANNRHFKNQGDCVSYFATNGRNTAAGSLASHSATGNVTLSNPSQTLSFNAVDNGASSSDTGNVSYSNLDANISYIANLSCANVNPVTKTAYFAYDATQSVGVWVIWKVVDGSPDAAGFTTAANGTDANALCETGFVPPVYNFTPISGDIVVQ